MKRSSTKPVRRFKVTDAMKEAYTLRDKRQDSRDRENPTLPPEAWDSAVIGKYYRPLKTTISLRVDADVLAWLKSKGAGHLTRINAILRERMQQDRQQDRH
jgi:uncharacterized protein (DUF4415 family)